MARMWTETRIGKLLRKSNKICRQISHVFQILQTPAQQDPEATDA